MSNFDFIPVLFFSYIVCVECLKKNTSRFNCKNYLQKKSAQKQLGLLAGPGFS